MKKLLAVALALSFGCMGITAFADTCPQPGQIKYVKGEGLEAPPYWKPSNNTSSSYYEDFNGASFQYVEWKGPPNIDKIPEKYIEGPINGCFYVIRNKAGAEDTLRLEPPFEMTFNPDKRKENWVLLSTESGAFRCTKDNPSACSFTKK